jgi:hypothetical protein
MSPSNLFNKHTWKVLPILKTITDHIFKHIRTPSQTITCPVFHPKNWTVATYIADTSLRPSDSTLRIDNRQLRGLWGKRLKWSRSSLVF